MPTEEQMVYSVLTIAIIGLIYLKIQHDMAMTKRDVKLIEDVDRNKMVAKLLNHDIQINSVKYDNLAYIRSYLMSKINPFSSYVYKTFHFIDTDFSSNFSVKNTTFLSNGYLCTISDSHNKIFLYSRGPYFSYRSNKGIEFPCNFTREEEKVASFNLTRGEMKMMKDLLNEKELAFYTEKETEKEALYKQRNQEVYKKLSA